MSHIMKRLWGGAETQKHGKISLTCKSMAVTTKYELKKRKPLYYDIACNKLLCKCVLAGPVNNPETTDFWISD